MLLVTNYAQNYAGIIWMVPTENTAANIDSKNNNSTKTTISHCPFILIYKTFNCGLEYNVALPLSYILAVHTCLRNMNTDTHT